MIRRIIRMTDNERELLNIIRGHDDPDQAVKFAIDLLIDFLVKREVPQGTSSEPPQEVA